jgi:hypothetical protein
MIGNLNTWKISLEDTSIENMLLDGFKISDPLTYLLDTNKTEYSIIEKFVYEIALFHFNRLNIAFDKNKYIEFWFKNTSLYENNNYHFDCDEYNKNTTDSGLITPLLSCVVYMDNSKIPTIITNIDKDTYDTMNFKENNTFVLCFPKYLKHISFNGGNNLHGMLKYNETEEKQRYILAINLWNVRPKFVPYFDYLTFVNKLFITDKERIENKLVYINNYATIISIHLHIKNNKTINIENNALINPEFFQNIFHNKKYNDILKLYEIIKEDLNNFDTFYFNLSNNNQNTISPIPIIESRNKDINLFDMSLSKFKQRMITPNIYSSIVCDWLVNAFDKHTPKEYIHIEELENIFSFCIESFSSILDMITKYYCLDNTITRYNILDTFIIKNTKNSLICSYNEHYDMVVTILLNDEFEGGGFYFDDGIVTFLEKGSMIVHNSNVNKYINDITYGNQYLLKIYIKIIQMN